MNDSVRDEIWVTVPVTGGPRVFVRTVELSELCLLMCPSPRCGQLPAWAQFWVDIVMPLTLHLATPRVIPGSLIAADRRHHTCLRDAREHCRPLQAARQVPGKKN